MNFSPSEPWNVPADSKAHTAQGRSICSLRLVALCLIVSASPALGAETTEELFTSSGRLKLLADYALDRAGEEEKPALAARLILDGQKNGWRLHSWLEGNWRIDTENQEESSLKSFDRVYGNDHRSLDLKELYIDTKRGEIDWQVGVQRFSWGRLDEFPINDLFNPWDYDQFIVKPMEERKIGVPALSSSIDRHDWNAQFVWVPWFIPCRLPSPGSRWAVSETDSEPVLPARNFDTGAIGLRIQWPGEIEPAVNIFHGYDPRPIFGKISRQQNGSSADWSTFTIEPVFHTITSVGMDAATVLGPMSFRGEMAWTHNRVFNISPELWANANEDVSNQDGLSAIEQASDTIDYGLAADYRPVEDSLVTIQVQQTILLSRPDNLYEQQVESLVWANLKQDWLNQKVETHCNFAYNPEHGSTMLRTGISYVVSDALKTNLTAIFLSGPPQSLFGRYGMNDQIRLELVFQW